MSYLVLARKWRPQSFADLIGQEHVSQTLANAIRSGRVHHAFLFTGARGVGKTSAARIFAKALNCETGVTAEPCNQCSSCLEIAEGNGTDVLEIDGASNTGVDDIRDLRDNIRYLPSKSRFKIFIIDEVHMLSINAFNALLKTLEEPPEHAKFILATTEPHKIPITILSRCQRFDFRKIPLKRVVDRLRQIVDAEGIDISDGALAMIARRGEGSMRDALSALDQVIAFCGDRVPDEDVRGLLGFIDRRLLFETLEGLIQRDCPRLLDLVRRVDHLGYSFRQYCRDLAEACRSLVFCRILDDPEEALDVTPEELDELKALAGQTSLEDLQRLQGALLRLEPEVAAASMQYLAVESSLLRLALLPPAEDVGTLLRKLTDLEKRLAGMVASGPAGGVPRPASPPPSRDRQEPAAKKAEAPVAPMPASGGWPGLIEQVRGTRPLLAAILEKASPLRLEPPEIEIGLPKGSFELVQLGDRDMQQDVARLASDYFGCPVNLRVRGIEPDREPAPPSLAEERRRQESDRRRRLREDALGHPLIRSAREIFGAEVLDVRPIDKEFV
ncbi:DNA polymerase III tau subunit [Geothermobacter ehrlichii]|uniref:DNA polymerase III subunit gamma/tau n=1 Tax=Geothermobacter ehrlichii TaxID=213224 RepID=A0A5D3WLG6_9BACT|nr:DNA polymerase III subunit gamma/tau [Geothermobacter ehrlichii]TYO98069.1 DNA polymerase III tau subunit [Geothermobacter ehrlichii]